jgi:hypothetical protein
MLVDMELREKLSYYCMVTKQTQEKAANVAIRQMLERLDGDPEMSQRIERAKQLKAAMDALYQPLSRAAKSGQ